MRSERTQYVNIYRLQLLLLELRIPVGYWELDML